MKTFQEIEELVKEKCDIFIVDLNGLFKEHVSDTFIKAYIKTNFMYILSINYNDNYTPNPINLAYDSCCYLFESLLEYGCNVSCNGHHVAQKFASLFPDDFFK